MQIKLYNFNIVCSVDSITKTLQSLNIKTNKQHLLTDSFCNLLRIALFHFRVLVLQKIISESGLLQLWRVRLWISW